MSVQTSTAHTPHYDRPDCRNLSRRPGSKGLPLIGHTAAIGKDINGFLRDHIEKYGHLARIGMGFQRGLLVVHPDHMQEIFLDKHRNFSSQAGYQDNVGRFFPGSFVFQDFDEHKVNRRMFQTAFKSSALRGYVDIINPTIAEYVENWDRKKDLRFALEVKHLILDIAGRAFFGIDDLKGEEIEALRRNFGMMLDGLMAIVKYEIPGLAYHRGMVGKRRQDAFLKQCFRKRRDDPGNDIASIMVRERTEEGRLYTDEELLPHMSMLLFAAHDTTTAASSHLMMYLADPAHEYLQDRLREEAFSLDTDNPAYDDLEKMVHIDRALSETLRLHPSAPVMTRRAVRDGKVGEVEVPAHTMLFIFNSWAHRNDEWWTDPEKFDPERFSPERGEHKNHSFCYAPFGGGAHKCIGMHVAFMEAKLIMFHLLKRYRFAFRDNYTPKLQTLPLPLPSRNLPLKAIPL